MLDIHTSNISPQTQTRSAWGRMLIIFSLFWKVCSVFVSLLLQCCNVSVSRVAFLFHSCDYCLPLPVLQCLTLKSGLLSSRSLFICSMTTLLHCSTLLKGVSNFLKGLWQNLLFLSWFSLLSCFFKLLMVFIFYITVFKDPFAYFAKICTTLLHGHAESEAM